MNILNYFENINILTADDFVNIPYLEAAGGSFNKQGKQCGFAPKVQYLTFGLTTFNGTTIEECEASIANAVFNMLVRCGEHIEPVGVADVENDKWAIKLMYDRKPYLLLYIAESRFDNVANKFYIKCSPVCLDTNKVKVWRK